MDAKTEAAENVMESSAMNQFAIWRKWLGLRAPCDFVDRFIFRSGLPLCVGRRLAAP